MAANPSVLDPSRRAADLERMRTETFDLVVIGGGVTGAGVALDAATRGLSVALVEQRDFAAGTSSRSSKLFHGGLRYLEQFDFGLVTEALHERNLMLRRLCPHLARPVSFLYPLTHRVWERAYVGAGIALYDVLAAFGDNPLPRHRHYSRRAATTLVPSLRDGSCTGGIRYWDAQVDDARHTMAVVRTAAAHGAAIATSVRAVDIHRDQGGTVEAISVVDLESGDADHPRIRIEARQVVNATGVWTDQIQDLVGGSSLRVRASKGVHLVVPRDRIDAGTGLICRTPKSVLFVIPWGAHWLVGTTDSDWELDLAHPAASSTDVDYLLDQANRWLDPGLTKDDVIGVYAGLRPLLYGESESTSKLSREHAVSTVTPGLITVAGGKYTTYRVMASDAVDAVVSALGRSERSRTADVPLVGAAGWDDVRDRRDELARDAGVAPAVIDHLLGRFGAETTEVLELLRQDPTLGDHLPGTDQYLAVEVHVATAIEGALHLDDVLTRRTRISIETADRGVSAAPVAARIMARVLDWDEATIAAEVGAYRLRVAAELDSQEAADDRTADERRLGAPDVRAFTP
ncbi:MAG: glycerol-3-phosphate dehydrogenase/oxidase [Acidimicrobiales bacterium]|nr:glycerol-3-phosphate dehydrogenase/oxidase [Acidimicrobiales bacterium]